MRPDLVLKFSDGDLGAANGMLIVSFGTFVIGVVGLVEIEGGRGCGRERLEKGGG